MFVIFFKENSKPFEIEQETIEVAPGKLGIILNWDNFEITDITENAQRCFHKIAQGWKIYRVDGVPVTKTVLLKKVKGTKNYNLQCHRIETKRVTMSNIEIETETEIEVKTKTKTENGDSLSDENIKIIPNNFQNRKMESVPSFEDSLNSDENDIDQDIANNFQTSNMESVTLVRDL
jgi:hypothetical protein